MWKENIKELEVINAIKCKKWEKTIKMKKNIKVGKNALTLIKMKTKKNNNKSKEPQEETKRWSR